MPNTKRKKLCPVLRLIHSSKATRALNTVTLICTHMASPVISVSVPNVTLTAPAMNGMIGGRPSINSVAISETTVQPINAQVPAAMP